MKPKIETRVIINLTARVRSSRAEDGTDESPAIIEGVAVEYGQRSEDLGGFIEKGIFIKFLSGHIIIMCVDLHLSRTLR